MAASPAKMASMKRVAVAVGCVLLAAALYIAVRPPAPTETPVATRAERRIVKRIHRDAPNDALAGAAPDARERAEVGTPVPFPDHLPPQYRPEGFEAAVNAALEACPDRTLDLVHIDCTEFPCMAFFMKDGRWNNQAMNELRACEGWSSRFEGGGQASSGFMTDEGFVEYSMASPAPPGSNFDENATKRWDARRTQGEGDLMAALGGRRLTPLEEIDIQIKFWREIGNDVLIADLEEQRARLVASPDAATP